MSFIKGYQDAMRSLPEGVRWAEANIKKTEGTIVTANGGAFDSASVENADAAYIRAAITGEGVAYTQDLSADPSAMILQAARNGLLTDKPAGCEALVAHAARSAGTLPPCEEMERLLGAACSISRMAQEADARVVSAICTIREDTHRAWVVNSLKADVESAFRVYTCALDVALQADGRTVNASALVTAKTLDGLDAAGAVRESIGKAEEQLLPQIMLEAGSYPAVLDHSVMCNIFITSWQLFSAIKYQTGASALSGLLGQTFASPAVTIVDRGAHALCGYAYEADDEGSAGSENILLERGTLKNLLHTRTTALQMNAAPTGNSGRVALLTGSIPTSIIPLPRVLTVEPGARSRQEMLKEMGDGLLIPFSFDIFHSINIGSGDFSIPCRAIVVREGKMIGQCPDLTMTGNLRDLLADVQETGSDLCIQPFLLRSYCYGAPSARVSNLKIG